MAFLGDFGKIFLGGSTTADVGGAVGGVLGAPQIGRNIGGAVAGGVSRLGEALDFNSPAAGVDSPSTIAPVSQTSNISIPGIPSFVQGTGMQQPQSQAFIGGLPGLVGQGLGQAARLLSRPGVGGAVGGFADFAVNAMSGRTKSRAYLREYEKTARDNVASTIEENKFQKGIDQGDVEVAQDQPIGDKPNEITLPANPDIIPSLEVIEDANGASSITSNDGMMSGFAGSVISLGLSPIG